MVVSSKRSTLVNTRIVCSSDIADQPKSVPPFQTYFPNLAFATKAQKSFYREWEAAWKSGEALDIAGNSSYVFVHLYEFLKKNDPSTIIPELNRVRYAYSQDQKLAGYCQKWISDCYVALGDLESAVNAFPAYETVGRSSASADNLLTLKLHANKPVTGMDLMALFGPKVTKFGVKHISFICEYLDSRLAAMARHQHQALLNQWVEKAWKIPGGYFIFSGSEASRQINILSYSFSLSPVVETFVSIWCRDAENTVRDEQGIPHVGEGWVAETELYYAVKKSFADLEVIQHGSPDWLGRQHLDILIPELGVGIEYQGLQHDQPVEFFGGEQAFQQSQKRDARKLKLCQENNIRLIYVRPGYMLEDIIDEVLKHSR